MSPLAPIEAEKKGLRPLAGPYTPGEDWMVQNVIGDMRRGGIDCALVEGKEGVEVWRMNSGWKDAR